MLRLNTIFFLVLFVSIFFEIRAQEKPNVVFIISDQHKLEATGIYGSKLAKTPNIDELGKTGVIFNNCYTPAPVCAPARAALITGMYPYANEAIYHKAPIRLPNGKVKNIGSGYLRETGYQEGIKTLPEIFREQNYVTAAPGKMHVHGELQKNVDEDYEEGNDMGIDETSIRYYTHFPGGHYKDEVGEDAYMRYRQFKKYKDVYPKGPMHLNQEYLPSLVENDEDNFDMVVARKSVEFIERRAEDGKNFFLHIGFEKPHAPFTTTQTYLDMHRPEDYALPTTYDDWYKKGKYPWSPNWIHSGIPQNNPKGAQNVMAAYNACITEMDDMVGRVIKSLKDNNFYENTIIIYTTDHGEHLFEHGLRGKHNMYEDAVNVPFIVSYPKLFKQNVFNNANVSLIDLMPTLTELINGKLPSTAQGVSLVNLLKYNSEEINQELANRAVFSEFRGANYNLLPGKRNVPSRMMKKGDFKFVYTHGIIDQLYNLKDDPDELNNLIFDKKHKDIYDEMYFQTLANWHFQEYEALSISIQKNVISWKDIKEYKNYSVYYSASKDFYQAKIIKENIKGNNFKVEDLGFYWVIAKPLLAKKSKFYGKDVPVAVSNYSHSLPISKIIEFNMK